jgi:hypothetical protein
VRFLRPLYAERGRGAGVILELAPDDFVVAGSNFHVNFRELEGPLRDAQILSLEEGTFEEDRWLPSRRLIGDELHVTLLEKARILRVRLLR